MPLLAYSDARQYVVPVYNLTDQTSNDLTVWDSTIETSPIRFQQIEFPNGSWTGNEITSTNTNLDNWKSPFPWEQSLTQRQLTVLNEVKQYDIIDKNDILNCHEYLFMDPGTSWNEQMTTYTHRLIWSAIHNDGI